MVPPFVAPELEPEPLALGLELLSLPQAATPSASAPVRPRAMSFWDFTRTPLMCVIACLRAG
jgi:hypothetical protein